MKWDQWSHVYKIVLFSGGKDSLSTLSLCNDHYEDLEAVYVDTSAGMFLETADYVKSICEMLNIPYKILKSPDFFKLASEWGFPSPKRRWCCRELKLRPIKEYIKTIKQQKVLFSGLRACESVKRMRWFDDRIQRGHDPATYLHPYFRCYSLTPIWDWTDNMVESYLGKKGLPINPAYKQRIHHLACPCVVYHSIKEVEAMRVLKPELFEKFKELETKVRNPKWKPLQRGKKYLYFRDLEKQELIDEWLG